MQRRVSGAKVIARLTVTDVFYAGEENGLMRRIDVQEASGVPVVLLAPLTQLKFDKKNPLAQDIAAYRRRRADRSAAGSLRGGDLCNHFARAMIL